MKSRASFVSIFVASLALALGGTSGTTRGDDLPIVADVEFQPLSAQARRVVQALDLLGQPLSPEEKGRIEAAIEAADEGPGIKTIQEVLDAHCLVGVDVNPESRVKSTPGPAAPHLVQGGWSVFLAKVHNEAGVTAELIVESPNAGPIYTRSTSSAEPKDSIRKADLVQRWCDVALYRDRPLSRKLSGLAVEYRILQVASRDAGRREAKLTFSVGQGSQDLGFRSDVDVLFTVEPAVAVTLDVRDEAGRPTTASFIFRDRLGRVYPSPSRRLAPDFFFHPQIYRADGETVLLPAGAFQVEYTRGPEYRVMTKSIVVPKGITHREAFQLERWIHLAAMNWFSGDHHVHAAGCAHYESPTEGVTPDDMWRHILGEDLDVGCVLSWGPCWYAQKAFFDGKVHKLSTPDNLMRYDVEVSGFPSSHAGHLCLLRLKEDDYPGTTRIEEWPSWDLPVLKWGKEQGGVVGFSHTGWGLKTESNAIPTDEIPPFDGIGGNEYIVDVVHDAVDFLSAVDTPIPWELNIWYHTLNCGFRTRISGETDFPCIYGERVGLGRVYVKLDGKLDFDRWCQGLKEGRSYVSDGHSHLIDFQVDDRKVGEEGSELKLPAPATVKVRMKAAALLAAAPSFETEAIRTKPLDVQPYWHVERARVGASRKVPVEIIVNGLPVERREIEADGSVQDLEFNVPIAKSSWVAARIFPTSHTNPIFVTVGDKPVRASKRSAEWCLKSVDQCWSQKEPAIRASEKDAARQAYEAARVAYRKILAECEDEKPKAAANTATEELKP
ncbi:CehA/McbA family metallohydrolase [Paludisphaera mucosa]|uniref:CehA/McbA family metallohydrolase n=1 Tax=Paludisphaera mucosa TaxID=3030827 RepID=A0ABT6F678_9BACT|nr:CehA/McbA family metallohydrolase [Paludisphaera mucosa]MDG3003081.1 CehA/McbA family metallohydrolase [Paludisphaera mucosa]